MVTPQGTLEFAAANVKLVKDAFFENWSSWTPCTKSCIGIDEKYGQMSRKRMCFNGKNGGQTCTDLLGHNSTKEQIEVHKCS